MVNTKITSIEHLKKELYEEWLAFSIEFVQNLINYMPKRVLVCNIEKHFILNLGTDFFFLKILPFTFRIKK